MPRRETTEDLGLDRGGCPQHERLRSGSRSVDVDVYVYVPAPVRYTVMICSRFVPTDT
jgi:hypothetical protein